jgi:hypothetical protein
MRFLTIITIIASFLMSAVVVAQDNISAVIDVRYEGVEIQRENTQDWLALPQGAIAFIGAGDTIRTTNTGRVDVLFDDTSHMLLLSNTDFTLISLTSDNDRRSLEGQVNGNAVVETSTPTTFDTFSLHLNDLTITHPASLISIWSFADVTDAVTVAVGTATVIANATDISIPTESGFLAEADRTEAISFDPEWHSAGLEAGLYGCDAQVRTVRDVPLLVRSGPGRGFLAMGTLDISRVVAVMAETETTGWSRIQFLTGFGWIQSLAIESNCTDLPVFPDDASEEKFVTVINVTDDELAILKPFFESPEANAFSYQFIANP